MPRSRRIWLARWRLKEAAAEAESLYGHAPRRRRVRDPRSGEMLDLVSDAEAADRSRVSHRRRCGWCRRTPVVDLVRHGEAYWFDGIVHCDSVWECPVCAVRICRERASELRSILSRHRRDGGQAYLLTLTVRHGAGDSLTSLRRLVAKGWTAIHRGKAVTEMRARFGVQHFVRRLEATHGKHGWHPHLHAVIGTSHTLSPREERGLRLWYLRRWRAWVRACGWSPPSYRHGVDLRRSTISEYIAKLGLSDEALAGVTKRARDGHRTPWEILADYADTRDPALGRLWVEWCEALRGARQLTWDQPRGRPSWRNRYPSVDLSRGRITIAVARCDRALWDGHLAHDPAARAEVLSAAESGDTMLLDALLGEGAVIPEAWASLPALAPD